MNMLYARLRNGSEAVFSHGGAIHMGVPKWVVKAYVEVRTDGGDMGAALAFAHCGALGVEIVRNHPKGVFASVVQAWAARLDQLEAAALAKAAAT